MHDGGSLTLEVLLGDPDFQPAVGEGLFLPLDVPEVLVRAAMMLAVVLKRDPELAVCGIRPEHGLAKGIADNVVEDRFREIRIDQGQAHQSLRGRIRAHTNELQCCAGVPHAAHAWMTAHYLRQLLDAAQRVLGHGKPRAVRTHKVVTRCDQILQGQQRGQVQPRPRGRGEPDAVVLEHLLRKKGEEVSGHVDPSRKTEPPPPGKMMRQSPLRLPGKGTSQIRAADKETRVEESSRSV